MDPEIWVRRYGGGIFRLRTKVTLYKGTKDKSQDRSVHSFLKTTCKGRVHPGSQGLGIKLQKTNDFI